mgnify:CR=1 FL=1
MKTTMFAMAAVMAALALGACESGQKADTTKRVADRIEDVRKSLLAGQGKLAEVMASLDTLASGTGNQRDAYVAYTKQVHDLEGLAKKVSSRNADLKARREQYVQQWQMDAQAVQNEQVKEQMQKRVAAVQSRFDEMRAAAEAVAEAYKPLIADLKDIELALKNDLTPAGVAALKPAMDKAKEEGADLDKALTALVKEFEKVEAELRPMVVQQ